MTLVTDSALMHPLAALVRISTGVQTTFLDLGLYRGLSARPIGDRLVFGNLWSVSGADARGLSAEDDFPSEIRVLDTSAVKKRGRLLDALQERKETLLRRAFFDGNAYSIESALPPTIFAPRFVAAARKSARFLEAGDARSAAEASLLLVGFGQGLTPTGDDFLCGFALAAWIRSLYPAGTPGALPSAVVQSWLDGVIHEAVGPPAKTSEVSLQFLGLARSRLFSRSLVAFARSCVPLSPDKVFADALAVLGCLGHSSGLDSATGFLFGLQ